MKPRKPKASRSRAPKGRETRRSRPYPFEFRLKVVQLHLQEGYPVSLLSEQFGISCHSVRRWSAAYRKRGESGLQPKIRSGAPRRVPAKVRKKAVAIKKRHPEYGARRISDILKRFFLMPASASTVQRELDQKGLTEKRARKPVKNAPKPRFFERSRPNQLWQSDIMTFRLGGRNAYLIGYIDDYSRYITGLGLHRSQTAAHVLETYRRAIAEYGVPKEMLTDNGRQYTNWRGKTRFDLGLRSVSIKLLQNGLISDTALNKFRRLQQSAPAAELKNSRHTNLHFMLAIYINTRYTGKHVSAIYKAQKQGRLHRRVLPAGPQRAPSQNPKAGRQNHPQLRQGRSA